MNQLVDNFVQGVENSELTGEDTMWQRLIRALASVLNMYSFYSNPLRFVYSLLLIIVVPYLVYVFWGTVILTLLFVLGIYLLYRWIRKRPQTSY